jgi:hypothetical protein
LKFDIEHIGDRTMITHRTVAGHNLTLLLTLALTASFGFSAACSPVTPPQTRVHAGATSLVLM